MEDKQLNFDKPLLSVRRFSSTVASAKDDKRKPKKSFPNIPRIPSYKSELKSGPIRNPGVVPFRWECSPGKPKDESKPQTCAVEQIPTSPKLPPGRIVLAKQKDSDNVSKEPTRSKNGPSLDENATKFESSRDTTDDKDTSELGKDDETYLDALDTLSRNESSFLNCSVSGISELEGPDSKPSGTFMTDQQARDFMIDRFLPAAKAMVAEMPQHAPRTQPVIREQSREVKKIVNKDKIPPLRYGPNFLQDYGQDDEERESDEEIDEHTNVSANICGLIPRFGLKSSFCLLNPLSGMSVRTRVPAMSVGRTRARSSSADSSSENENEYNGLVAYEQRKLCRVQKTELHVNNDNLKDDSKHVTHQAYGRLHGSGIASNCSKQSQLSADRNQISNMENDTANLVVEKTLYVDTVHKVESPDGVKILLEKKEEEISYMDFSSKNTEKSNALAEEGIVHPNGLKHVDHDLFWSDEKSKQPVGMEQVKGIDNLKLEHEFQPHLIASEESHRVRLEFPAPPPLPKSPSDSWLLRTLPSMSSRYPSPFPYLGTAANSGTTKVQKHQSRFPKVYKGTNDAHTRH